MIPVIEGDRLIEMKLIVETDGTVEVFRYPHPHHPPKKKWPGEAAFCIWTKRVDNFLKGSKIYKISVVGSALGGKQVGKTVAL